MPKRITSNATPRRPERVIAPPSVAYVVEVGGWHWNVDLDVVCRDTTDHASDTLGMLLITGGLLEPRLPKVAAVDVRLLPGLELERLRALPAPPPFLGAMSIGARSRTLVVLLTVPDDTFKLIHATLMAGKLRTIRLGAAPLFRGEAKVTRFGFDTAPHEAD